MSRFLVFATECLQSLRQVQSAVRRAPRSSLQKTRSRQDRLRKLLVIEPAEDRILLSATLLESLPTALLAERGAALQLQNASVAASTNSTLSVQALRVNKVSTTINGVFGTSVKGGTATLSATLKSEGSPLAGQIVRFQVRGRAVGKATTDAKGVAILSGVKLQGIKDGTYPGAVNAVFAGDRNHKGSSSRGSLVVGQQATSLGDVSGSGSFGGSGRLSAALQSNGKPLSGQVIHFALNGKDVGSASTNAQGVAVLSGVNLSGVNAGTYANAVTVRYDGGVTYQQSTGKGALSVSRAQATIKLGNLNQTYDGSAKAVSATTTPSGRPITIVYSDAHGNKVASPTDAGTYHVTATINGTNYRGNATGTLVVAPIQIQVSGITGGVKAYDGTTQTTLVTTNATLQGVISADAVTLVTTGATGTFQSKNVGTNKAVTVAGLTLAGADAGNYVLVQPTATGEIAAAVISGAGFVGSNKVYDGNTDTTVDGTNATLVGLVEGDAVTLNIINATGHFDTKNVGVGKTITIGGLTITGADASNYTLVLTTTTADITQAELTVSGILASDKPFDGSTNTTLLTDNATLNGVIAGDAVTLVTTGATGNFDSPEDGTGKTVFITGLSLDGADAPNYSVTQPTALATITPPIDPGGE